ncbi:IclR family transcriptional regulator [Janibacter melonis]|uniref:IclR family transcriptional regulator n=1 Tax=Janibacter melonis TaxID=262209 RepID=A0A176QGI7_9MICO|nr:IclR family transcriptional regulator C-terminal domain-containing protein [Janibacter melonis]OAB88823.1 IclR family transcriptional regulator [Janibacter melonis]
MAGEDRDEIGSLVKAFALLQVFSAENPRVTITSAAELAGLTRPTARRILITCANHGFVESDGREFWLTPKIMRLGFGYLSALPFWEPAMPKLRALAEEANESTSMAALDGHEIVYLLRQPVRPGLIPLNVGSRLPAHATSLGKALLAFAPAHDVEHFLARAPFEALTPSTITTAEAMRAELERVRSAGYAISDGERELGVRSAAAPVLGRGGVAVAAINISANAVRISHEEMEERLVPLLVRTASLVSEDVRFQGAI